MTLYVDLGVMPDATPEEVKAAHRRMAAATHPDGRSPDEALFKRIQHAYEVLSDPARRARYDATGDANWQQDSPSRAMQVLAGLMIGLVNSVDVVTTDLVATMRLQIGDQQHEKREAIRQFEKRVRQRELAAKRMRRKTSGDNMLLTVLEADAQNQRHAIERVRADIALLEEMLAVLGEYEYVNVADDPVPTDLRGETFRFLRGLTG